MAEPALTILLIHCLATLFMTGLIWFVQIVHYPLLAAVGASQFTTYEERHKRLTTGVVAPVMLLEVVTALGMIWCRPEEVPASTMWLNLILLALIWLSTAMLQVPCHARLTTGFHSTVHRVLVLGNWIRVALWSGRAILMFWILSRLMTL